VSLLIRHLENSVFFFEELTVSNSLTHADYHEFICSHNLKIDFKVKTIMRISNQHYDAIIRE
jgi:hypothetical protein